MSAIVKAWEDDLFEVQIVDVTIPSFDATFGGSLTQPSEVATFRGPGEYAMRYQWALTKNPSPRAE